MVHHKTAEDVWLAIGQAARILFYNFYKITTTQLPRNLHAAIFQLYIVNTRAAAQGQIRYGENFRGNNEMTRASFKYRAQQYYSTLPRHIKSQSLGTFKVKLKKYASQHIPVR